MTTRQFGAPIPRREDPRLLTGNGRYLDDLGRDALQAAFVRSPYAHARIIDIDIADAFEAEGVEAIYTWEDLDGRVADPLPVLIPHPALTHPHTGHCLAREEVNHVGEAVVMVVARDRYLAEDAAARITVRYEQLPAVVGIPEARAGEHLVHEDTPDNIAAHLVQEVGDVTAAMAASPRTLTLDLEIERSACMPMEGKGVYATWDPDDGTLRLWDPKSGANVLTVPSATTVYAAAFSPDGMRVTFSGLQGATGDIFVVDLGTGQVTNVTNDAFADYAPSFAPDGRSLVYSARISGNDKLFRVALDGGAKTQLTFGTHDDTGAKFLDPKTVVFTSTATDPAVMLTPEVARNGNIPNVWSLDVTNGELKQWTDAATGNVSPVALPEGSAMKVAFVSYNKGQNGEAAGRPQSPPFDRTPGRPAGAHRCLAERASSRSVSLLTSRSAMSRRRSTVFLGLPSANSTFTRLPLKYSRSGTIDTVSYTHLTLPTSDLV